MLRRLLSPRLVLLALLSFQVLSHAFWLPISVHSGQTAIPWMMNNGMVLFGDILEQHAPLTSVLAAGAQRLLPFAPDAVAILLNVLLVTALALLIDAVAIRLTDGQRWAGVLAVAVWVWWVPVFGNVMFYFNTLLALCALLGAWLLLRMTKPTLVVLFAVGCCLGAATLAKQQGWAAVGAVGLWLLWRRYSARYIVGYALGVLLLPLLTLLAVTLQGNLASYIYWNWTFNLSGLMDGVPLDSHFFRKLLLANMLVPAFALLTLRDATQRKHALLVLLLFGATAILLYPRFSEIAAIAHLPFTAIMSGVVLQQVLATQPTWRDWWQKAGVGDLTLAGVGSALVLGWLWTGAVMYIPTPLGVGGTPAYDEYRPLVAQIAPLQEPGDTLFVLPQTDSTPQLHPMTGMLPPTTWIKGWRWYFEAPDVVAGLLDEWADMPPTFVVIFPGLLAAGQPGIAPLVEFVEQHYQLSLRIPDVYLHGEALVYERQPDSCCASASSSTNT